MYKTQNIDPSVLKDLPIKNQELIIKEEGAVMSLADGWEEIKRESKNFTVENADALEADKLLFQFLEQSKVSTSKPSQEKERLRLQEQERIRAIELLELELELGV